MQSFYRTDVGECLQAAAHSVQKGEFGKFGQSEYAICGAEFWGVCLCVCVCVCVFVQEKMRVCVIVRECIYVNRNIGANVTNIYTHTSSACKCECKV